MPIPGTILGSWSQHHSTKASIQAHTSIRETLRRYNGWIQDITFDMLLQGSYKNAANLRRDSDVDLVIQLSRTIEPQVATLNRSRLERDESHTIAYRKWQSFRDQKKNVLQRAYGTNAVVSGRKSLKIARGRLPAAADVAVTIHCEDGIAFFLPDEHRWIVSYPKQHYKRGLRKERATNNRFKRTIRMFKATRGYLIDNNQLQNDTAPSYFIECLLYNAPNEIFRRRLVDSYKSIVEYLSTTNLRLMKSQNGKRELFGSSPDLWSERKARRFIRALARLWDRWPSSP
jgi:hypothetical protein